jgi:hypothetical protein
MLRRWRRRQKTTNAAAIGDAAAFVGKSSVVVERVNNHIRTSANLSGVLD